MFLTKAYGNARQAMCWSAGTKMETNMTIVRKIVGNNKGATAIEYGLIAALIAVAAVAAMGYLGNKINSTFNNVSANLK